MAGAAQAQTPVKGPVTETVTVTGYSQWGVRYATAAEAEAHVRENDHVYGSLVAAGLGGSHDGRLRSWKVVDVEIKRNPESEHYQFMARTKVEAVLDAWKRNIPKDEDEDEDNTEEEVWIEDEVERKIAELEAEEKALGKSIEDKLVSDLLDKINDIEVMQNTFVGVLTRLGSKGPALGLWKGGLTADRYVSRLSEMAARVQQVKNSVTGLHDHALGRTQSLLDDFMREFDELDDLFGDDLDLVKTYDGKEKEWAALGHDTFTEYHEARRADRKAYSEAQSDMWQAVHNARMQSIRYDHGMEEEKRARVYRRGRIKDTADTLRWRAQMDRQTSSDTPPPAGEEAVDTPQAGLLQKALKKELDQEDLRQALGAEDATETPSSSMRTAARPSPIRAAKTDTASSGIRRAAGVEAKDTSAIDADGEVLGGGRQSDPTAPRVETPQPVSAFDLAREGVLRETQEKEAGSIQFQFTEIAFNEIGKRIDTEQSANPEAFVLLGYLDKGTEHRDWERCNEGAEEYNRTVKEEFYARCPAQHDSRYKKMKETSASPGELYRRLSATCSGNFYVYIGSDSYPEDETGLRDYLYWWWNENGKLNERRNELYPCGDEPALQFLRLGDPVHIVIPEGQSDALRQQVKNWLSVLYGDAAEVRIAVGRGDISERDAMLGGPMPDLSGAPFTLYENSALKELRDMQKEYQ
ncbi:MAG: hypothetical protein MRY81_16470 [Donghicola eburneus]|nr:hypothetical protein [Donghicola eburneus]MCI5041265.1 hypothetical protein [Donghicola eburneus]